MPVMKKKAEVRKTLIEDRKERSTQRREVSPHVVSRFYRPPEVILLERRHTGKVDLWSCGLILLELVL